MTDISTLERDILGAMASAPDEAALETVRVAALGKKGSISELLKTLGGMSADERKVNGPLFNGLRDKVAAAIAARKSELGDAALNARLALETVDVTLPPRPGPQGSIHPVSQVFDEITTILADSASRSAKGRTSNMTTTIHQAEHPARSSGAADAGHVLSRQAG